MNAPLQAFVLKCPECGAPQPGTTATCTHCKVPLMWAPTRRFGSDDHGLYDVEDEPGTELMSFGPVTVPANAEHVFQIRAEKVFRILFLRVHPRCADNFYVGDVRVGVNVVLDGKHSGDLFSRSRGFPLPQETLVPGIYFTFRVWNQLGAYATFEATLRTRGIESVRAGNLRERFPGEWGPVIVGGKK